MTTFFGKVRQFDDIPEDGQINLDPYLLSAEGASTIIDLMGVAFSPVKADMTGNIKKLKDRQATNPEKFTTVTAVLKDEKENKTSTEGQTGALWLCRGLQFIQQLLVHLLDRLKNNPEETAFRPVLMAAYEDTLKQYHGFISKTLFSTISRACPNRPGMMKLLALDQEGKDDEVVKDIEKYLVNLKKTNEAVMKNLTDLGFDITVKA